MMFFSRVISTFPVRLLKSKAAVLCRYLSKSQHHQHPKRALPRAAMAANSLQVVKGARGLQPPKKTTMDRLQQSYRNFQYNIKYYLGEFKVFMIKERVLPFYFVGGRQIRFQWTNICGHGAFLYLALSYLETDFWNLRLYATGGIVLSMFFQYYRPQPLWIPIKWNVIFLVINAVMIAQIYYEYLTAENVTEEQRSIYTKLFRDLGMNNVSYFRLMSCAERLELEKGDHLITAGEHNDHLSLVVSGALDVIREGEAVSRIEPDQFCGEMSFLQWKDELRKHLLKNPVAEPDTVHILGVGNIVASEEGAVVYRWNFWDLHKLFLRDMSVGVVVERLLSNDLNNKLQNNWKEEPVSRYKQIMSGAMIDGLITPNERNVLREFRTTHGITEAQHLKVLKKLNWTEEEFKRGYKGEKDRAVDVYVSMLMDMLSPARRISEDTKKALREFRIKNNISGPQHVVCLNSVGWTLNEYEVSEHKSYVASEDPTNIPEPDPTPIPLPLVKEDPVEEQNPLTKYFYVSTGRRKRAKEALIAMWDKLFDTEEEKHEKELEAQRAIATALANSIAASLDPDDPTPREDDDVEFKLNSWYPAVLMVGAAAVMLNGKI